jgi:hypothetical protein
MMFLVRAGFWLAVVSVFVPHDFAGEATDLPFDTAAVSFDANESVSEWCEDQAILCEAGEEAARLGGFLADMATDRIEVAIAEYNEDES